VTATYLAHVGEEEAADSGFGHWVAVRRGVLVLYLVLLGVWSAHYGIPVQRELVVAWVCGALACASLGRSWREVLRLACDWLPLMILLSAYDFTRGAADRLGIGVHVHPMIDFDRFLFFGTTPTQWLQAHMNDPKVVNWIDVAFTLIYTSYFIVPFTVAGFLWARDRLEFLRFSRRIATLFAAGLATYIAFPAAPPWMAAHMGLLHGVARTTVGRLAGDRRTDGRVVRRGPGNREPGRRGAIHSLGVHAARGAVPMASRAPPAAAVASALSASHGADAHGHGRALLLRRPGRVDLRRQRDGRMGVVGTPAGARDGPGPVATSPLPVSGTQFPDLSTGGTSRAILAEEPGLMSGRLSTGFGGVAVRRFSFQLGGWSVFGVKQGLSGRWRLGSRRVHPSQPAPKELHHGEGGSHGEPSTERRAARPPSCIRYEPVSF
jgi:PAP2 superfamily